VSCLTPPNSSRAPKKPEPFDESGLVLFHSILHYFGAMAHFAEMPSSLPTVYADTGAPWSSVCRRAAQ
jgi:hypothetical protein